MATVSPQDDYMKTALRLPRELHGRLVEHAQHGGRSFNSEVVQRLHDSFETPAAPIAYELERERQAVVDQVAEIARLKHDGDSLREKLARKDALIESMVDQFGRVTEQMNATHANDVASFRTISVMTNSLARIVIRLLNAVSEEEREKHPEFAIFEAIAAAVLEGAQMPVADYLTKLGGGAATAVTKHEWWGDGELSIAGEEDVIKNVLDESEIGYERVNEFFKVNRSDAEKVAVWFNVALPQGTVQRRYRKKDGAMVRMPTGDFESPASANTDGHVRGPIIAGAVNAPDPTPASSTGEPIIARAVSAPDPASTASKGEPIIAGVHRPGRKTGSKK